MKQLAVAGVTLIALEKVNGMQRLSKIIPYVGEKYNKATRVVLDVTGIIGGGYLAGKEGVHWALKGMGAGIAIHSAKDLVDSFVPDLA